VYVKAFNVENVYLNWEQITQIKKTDKIRLCSRNVIQYLLFDELREFIQVW